MKHGQYHEGVICEEVKGEKHVRPSVREAKRSKHHAGNACNDFFRLITSAVYKWKHELNTVTVTTYMNNVTNKRALEVGI